MPKKTASAIVPALAAWFSTALATPASAAIVGSNVTGIPFDDHPGGTTSDGAVAGDRVLYENAGIDDSGVSFEAVLTPNGTSPGLEVDYALSANIRFFELFGRADDEDAWVDVTIQFFEFGTVSTSDPNSGVVQKAREISFLGRRWEITPSETEQVTIVQHPRSFRVIAHPPTLQQPQWPDILAE